MDLYELILWSIIIFISVSYLVVGLIAHWIDCPIKCTRWWAWPYCVCVYVGPNFVGV